MSTRTQGTSPEIRNCPPSVRVAGIQSSEGSRAAKILSELFIRQPPVNSEISLDLMAYSETPQLQISVDLSTKEAATLDPMIFPTCV